MQELVEIIRRDHALLHDRVREEDPALARTMEVHLAFLDLCVGPAVVALGPDAGAEWSLAREALIDSRERADSPPDGAGSVDDVAEAVRRHAEQMEQVVLPRLVGELEEETLSDLTVSALRFHEDLPLSEDGPVAMRAELTDAGPDASRPAGA